MAQRKVLITLEVEDGQAETRVKKLVNAFDQLDDQTARTGSGMRNAFLQADLAARGIALITQEVTQGIQEYVRYNRELANLNTLLDDGRQIDKFRDGLVRLDPHLGETSELARGMYQAISSGVDAGDALAFIETSAKAARAGIASTFETVDAGTTILASFKLEAKDATMVYDKMFEVVKRGKIEMPQLAQSIGMVANIAAQTGVTLDETFAVIATASTTIRPTQAIEGFRTLLANILKPSEQALEVARRLNVEFSEDALRRKGFAGFLNDITTAANGNKEVLARLFGDVQALNVVMAITGNRAQNLAKDLKGIAAASGTVEAAFQKQKQSIDSQLSALKVTVQQFLIRSFMLVEPLLTGLLSIVNKYPAIFGAAAVAIAGLAAAHFLWNTQLLLTAGTYIPQLIANLRNLITVMFAFSQVTALSTTGMLAFAAGWAGIVLAIGIVVVALVDFESAAERANKITVEQAENQAKAYESAKKLVDAVREVSAAQEGSADRHERLNNVLGQLDPATRTYIEALREERAQVTALTADVERNLAARKVESEATLRLAGAGILDNLREIEAAELRIQGIEAQIRKNQELLSRDPSWAAKLRPAIDSLSNDIDRLRGRKEELRKQLEQNEAKLIVTARALNLNRDQLVQFFQASGYAAAGAKELADRYDKLTPKIESTNEALRQQVLDIDSVRNALKALKETGSLEIETQVLDIVKKAKNSEEAKLLAREALKNDENLRKLIEQRRTYNAAEKAAREVLDPSDKTATRRDRGNAIQSTTDEVRKLRSEVEALQRNGGVLYKLKIDKSDLEQTKSDLENILKLRHQLTLPLTAPLPKDLAGIRDETRVLNEQKKIVDAVTEAKHAQMTAEFELAQLIITSTLPLVNAEARAQKLYVQGVRERANAELDLTAQLNTAVRLRREALEAEQGTLRDTRQQYTQLRLDAVKAAEDARLADIRSQIEFAVAFGKEPELQQRLQIELNRETDQIKPPLVEMNGNVKTLVKQLESILGALSGRSGGTTAAGATWTLESAQAWIKSRGFEVISTTGGRHNVGSLHYQGRALDVRTRGRTAAEVEELIAAGRAAGLDVLDERRRPKGQKVWGGPHLHFGLQSGRRVQSLPQGPTPPVATPEPLDDVLRAAARGAGVNLANVDQATRLIKETTLQRNAIIDLQHAEQDLKNTREADLALRKKLFEESGKTLEQLSIQAALHNRERERIKEDLAAATAAGVVQHDLALARVRDAQYVQRVTVEAERARAAAAKSTADQLIADEAHLFQLQSGNAEALRQLRERAAAVRVQGHVSLYGEIAKLEDQIAHAGEDAALRHKLAWLQAVRDVQEASEQAAISQIQSQVKLADATVYHADQANARVMEFLASQKSVTESIADFKVGLIQSGFDSIDRGFQKLIGSGNSLKKLLADLLASLTKLALTRFLAPLFGGGQSGGGGGGNLLGTLFNFLRPAGGGASGGFSIPGATGGFAGGPGAGQFLNFGGAGIAGSGASQARGLSNLFQGANPFSAFTGSTLTPPVSLTSQLAQQSSMSGAIQQAQSFAPSATGGFGGGLLSGLSGLAKGFAPLAPIMGVALGASLGGQSRTGSILGAIGGGLAGLGILGGLSAATLGGIGGSFGASIATGLGGIFGTTSGLGGAFAGLFGGAGSLASFAAIAGPLALIAAPLVVGALILRRNAARRRDETTRNQAMLDSLGQLDEILRAVKTDRMDGGSALASAAQIRTQYVQAMGALKDKKTREIALRDVSRLDLKIAQIRGEADQQLQRQEIDRNLVPEFNSGGFTPDRLSLIKVRPGELFLPPDAQLQLARNGGFIPGPDYGRDSTFMLAPANSLVVPQPKAPSVTAPSLTNSGASSFSSGGSRHSREQGPVMLSIGELTLQAQTIEVDQDAGTVTVKGLRTPTGKDAFARTYKELSDEGRLR